MIKAIKSSGSTDQNSNTPPGFIRNPVPLFIVNNLNLHQESNQNKPDENRTFRCA